MRSTKATRWLSGTLAALLLAQGMCLPAGAWSWGGWGNWGSSSQTSQVETLGETQTVQLQNGTAIIPSDATPEQVKEILFDKLVANKEGLNPQSLEWEYKCEGKSKTGLAKNTAWGSIGGFESTTGNLIKVTYTHPALAANEDGSYQVRLAGTTTEVTLTKAAKLSSSITLNEGVSVALPYDESTQVDYDALRAAIFKNVVASTTPELTLSDVTIEYYATATTGSMGDLGKAWMPLEGGKSNGLTYPGMTAGENQQIRISYAENSNYYGTSAKTTVTITERTEAPYTLKETPDTVVLAVDENMKVDYDAVHDAIFNAVVASSDVLTADNVAITYYTKSLTEADAKYVALEGEKGTILTWPAISAGTQSVRIYFAGNQQYAPTTIDATITVAERSAAPYTLKDTPDAVTLTVDETLAVDYDALEIAIFNAVVASSDVITVDNVTITYESTAKIDIGGILPKDWVALAGETKTYMNIPVAFPAISAGEQKIRIFWPGNQQYAPTTIEATVTVNNRDQVQFNLNEAPYEVGMIFNAEQGYDYAATAKAIYNAVVASTINPEGLTADDVTVEYNVDKTGITDSFKPLNETDATGFVKFGTGTWEIRISWAGNQTYRGNHVDVNVTTTDNRLASAVALKSGASFTYNMDANAMKQAIFDNVIDWDNSTLPAKETLSLNNFVIEYYGKVILFDGGIDSEIEGWAPIEGKSYDLGDLNLGTYPKMGAGENQSIRISYKGNADYRPSETTEGTVAVNKAKVSVKVNSTNIYADEQVPANFITTDPADEFDIYTIYAGVTSSVSTGVYLDLPDRYTNNAVLKLLDPIVEKLYGKSFTQMMNDGVTVGELRELFSTQELLDLLDKLNIDTGTFGQILSVINKLPGVMDSVRIGFGTPNRAGLYTVTAITDNKNYETGVGFGFLLTKMRFSGPKLTWNDEILNGKLTAEQAQNFNFGATLWYNGEPVEDQSSVHYLYSGFTSSWRVYSSTTTAPTEPGRYVVTVCILGGNYMAAPITRSFQITK